MQKSSTIAVSRMLNDAVMANVPNQRLSWHLWNCVSFVQLLCLTIEAFCVRMIADSDRIEPLHITISACWVTNAAAMYVRTYICVHPRLARDCIIRTCSIHIHVPQTIAPYHFGERQTPITALVDEFKATCIWLLSFSAPFVSNKTTCVYVSVIWSVSCSLWTASTLNESTVKKLKFLLAPTVQRREHSGPLEIPDPSTIVCTSLQMWLTQLDLKPNSTNITWIWDMSCTNVTHCNWWPSWVSPINEQCTHLDVVISVPTRHSPCLYLLVHVAPVSLHVSKAHVALRTAIQTAWTRGGQGQHWLPHTEGGTHTQLVT